MCERKARHHRSFWAQTQFGRDASDRRRRCRLPSNGSDLLGISPYLQQAIIGAVIILAATVDELRKRRAEA